MIGGPTIKVKATSHPVPMPGSGGSPALLRYLRPEDGVVEVPNNRYFWKRIKEGDLVEVSADEIDEEGRGSKRR